MKMIRGKKMRVSPSKTSQINAENNIVLDYGNIYSKKDLQNICKSFFKGSIIEEGQLLFESNGNKFALYLKNVSYLGKPHPEYKLRIQVSGEFKRIYEENKKVGIETLILGIYSYKDTIIFCDFGNKTYLRNNLNNSSAHVLIFDLQKAMRDGIIQKEDARGNLLTLFTPEKTNEFLAMKFNGIEEMDNFLVNTFNDFFKDIDKEWYGKDCYTEMFNYEYRSRKQAEWMGFYFEFQFEKYLKKNANLDIKFYQHRGNGVNKIDLDLIFPNENTFGDLKTHSVNSKAIQGNDYATVSSICKAKGTVYYIVLNVEPYKDNCFDYAVTMHWNELLKKKNLYSYKTRMKNKVRLKSYEILEINEFNFCQLSVFQENMKNSNGSKRKKKIMIDKSVLDKFLLRKIEF